MTRETQSASNDTAAGADPPPARASMDGQPADSSPPHVDRSTMLSVPLFRVRRGRKTGLCSVAPSETTPPRPTVLARTLALAHRLQAMLDDGRVKNRAALAARFGFSRARITQIMELLWLAPDIQEEILHSVSQTGRDSVTARDAKPIARTMDWCEQRALWRLTSARRRCEEVAPDGPAGDG